jgi:hypothetical protein
MTRREYEALICLITVLFWVIVAIGMLVNLIH